MLPVVNPGKRLFGFDQVVLFVCISHNIIKTVVLLLPQALDPHVVVLFIENGKRYPICINSHYVTQRRRPIPEVNSKQWHGIVVESQTTSHSREQVQTGRYRPGTTPRQTRPKRFST